MQVRGEIGGFGRRQTETLRPRRQEAKETAHGDTGGEIPVPLEVIVTRSPAPADLHSLMERLACLLRSDDLAGLIDAKSAAIPEYEPSFVMSRKAQ